MAEIKKTPSQLKAIETKGKNIIVSAAAGSGKTFVLVERVISIMLKEKVDIDRMIIVTFTNKSANDMKSKIRTRLEERKDEFDPSFIKRQFKLLNKAHIKTLHSFCADMIRENFYYFDDLSPNFKVVAESTNTILKLESIDEIFDQEYEKMTDSFRLFLQNFATNRDDDRAKSVILDTYEMAVGQLDPLAWLFEKTKTTDSLQRLKDLAKKSLENFKEMALNLSLMANENNMRDKLQEVVTEDFEIFDRLLKNIGSWDSFIKSAQKTKFPRLGYSKKDDQVLYNKIKSTRNFYKARFSDLNDLIRNSEEGLIDLISDKERVLLGEIRRLTKLFIEKFSKKKKDRSYLDFSDMEHFFISLINNDTARVKLRSKFAYIFFDEYQDSNEIQNYIIDKLKKDHNLFFVGDVKQSIYGFRRANPKIFLEKLKSYEKDEDSKRINLNENFRTDKLILDFNNYIFDRLMTIDTSGIDYKFGGHRLNFAKDEENLNSRVALKIIDRKIPEEDYLINLIEDLVKDGYEYRDIAILLRSGNKSYAYEEAFKRANIPYFNDISKVSFRAAEVGFFINILRLLVNPNDDLCLLSVLRSEIFGFDEEDLAKIRLSSDNIKFYEAFKSYDKDDDILKKIDSFNKIIKDLKDKLSILKLYDFANYLFEKTGLYDFLMARDLGTDRVNNIESLIDLMGDFDRSNDNGVYGFLSFYENISKDKKDTIDQSRDLSEDENLIRMMTIHKSKGLEFKVVILADSDRTIRDMASRKNIVFDDKLGIGIDIANYEEKVKISSLNKKLITEKINKEEKMEEIRILYVALTRAEERLYITGSKSKDSIKKFYQNTDYMAMSSHLDWLISILSFDKKTSHIFSKEDFLTDFLSDRISIDYVGEIEEIEESEDRDINKLLKMSPNTDDLKLFRKYLDYSYAFEDDIKRPLKKSVTELAKDFDSKEEGYEKSSFGEEFLADDFKKPSFMEEEKTYSALEVGTIIHKVFENLEIKAYTKDKLKDSLDKLLLKKQVGKEDLDLIDLDKFLAFYQSDLIKKVLKEDYRLRKEESFLMKYEDFYVNGQIDLLFESDKDIILIDFKTDRLRRETAYQKQLEIYKLAIEEALGKKVSKSFIYWYNFKEFDQII